MKSYDGATLMFNGEALHTGAVEMQEMPRHGPLTFDATATTGTDAAELFGMVRREAAKPYGVVSLLMPWSILGNISVDVHATGGGPLEVSPRSAATTLEGEMRERDLRRAVSMAVERAIVNPYTRDHVVCNALAARAPSFNRMAHRLGYSRPGGCYRGERKQRKAMRRLLRAAGAMAENRPSAWLSTPLSAEEQARVDVADVSFGVPW